MPHFGRGTGRRSGHGLPSYLKSYEPKWRSFYSVRTKSRSGHQAPPPLRLISQGDGCSSLTRREATMKLIRLVLIVVAFTALSYGFAQTDPVGCTNPNCAIHSPDMIVLPPTRCAGPEPVPQQLACQCVVEQPDTPGPAAHAARW
jgi:hypothetical protein